MPTFSIIDTATDEPLEGVTFDDGAIAAGFVKAVNSSGQGKKFRVFKNPEPAVPDRNGYTNGTYRRTPWHSTGHRESSLWEHIIDDADGGKLIRFIDPETKQWAQAKPGRVLTRFYSRVFSATEIERWTKRVDVKPPVLLYTRDPDEIERVYTSGPSSCMSYTHSSNFSHLPEHPTRVYASPDLELCYAQDDDGAVYGRVLVRRDQKIYGRVYAGYKRAGDNSYNNDPAFEVPFTDALEAAGLHRGELDGARIRKVRYGSSRWVMPYLDDDDMGATDTGDPDYLFIETDGEISGKETCGASEAEDRSNYSTCDCCSRSVDSDDLNSVVVDSDHNTEDWCDNCSSGAIWVPDLNLMVDENLVESLDLVQVENKYGYHWYTREYAKELFVERYGAFYSSVEVADQKAPLQEQVA